MSSNSANFFVVRRFHEKLASAKFHGNGQGLGVVDCIHS